MSEKRDNFCRLANARVDKATAAIRNLRSLFNSVAYESSPEDLNKIISALDEEMSDLRDVFAGTKTQLFS